ncbi:MAG TPA: hypothetical protein PKY59_04865, partial [Pyrinomonadaceae bacterium]|nr:hypothetical protein [Pyrinomonadaceae bacterium]
MFYRPLKIQPKTLKSVCTILAVCGFLMMTLAAQTRISAATFTVTNTADSGAGSLRQAVADANATPAADTINFNIPTSNPNCNSNAV